MALSRIQQLVTRVLPASWAASMERESRAWVVRCPACGCERSIWELGGIRWKATGKKRLWLRCPCCRARGWKTLARREVNEAR